MLHPTVDQMALLPPLRQYGIKLPIKALREPFEYLHGWIEVSIYSGALSLNRTN